MDFRITMGPWLDWMFTLMVVGGAIVFWTIIMHWLITEVKSWFVKDEDDEIVAHNPQFDPTTVNVYNNMADYSAKDIELTQQLFNPEADLSMLKKPTEADAGIVMRQGLGKVSDLMTVEQLAAYSPSEETNAPTKPSYIVQWSKYGSFVFDDDDMQSELTQDTAGAVRRLVNEFGDGYIRWQFSTDGPTSWVDNGFVTKELLEMATLNQEHSMESKNA